VLAALGWLLFWLGNRQLNRDEDTLNRLPSSKNVGNTYRKASRKGSLITTGTRRTLIASQKRESRYIADGEIV